MSDTTGPQINEDRPRRRQRLGDGTGFVLDALRARPVARRMLTGLSVLLAVIGIGLLGYPFVTNIIQDRLQSKLAIQFNKPETKRAYQAGHVELGDPVTRISIPAIDLKPTVVVEG